MFIDVTHTHKQTYKHKPYPVTQ